MWENGIVLKDKREVCLYDEARVYVYYCRTYAGRLR